MSCGESSDPARWRLRYRRGTAKECLRAKQRYEVSPLRVTCDQMEEEGGTVDSCVLVFFVGRTRRRACPGGVTNVWAPRLRALLG
jgi:hypothetical protein